MTKILQNALLMFVIGVFWALTLAALSVVDKVYFPNHDRYLPQSRLNALEIFRVLEQFK